MTPNPPPREVTVEHPDKVAWLVTAVPHKGERFTHGYAFFSEASALHYIEREKVEDDERAAFGHQRIHVPDSWQVVRYIPESSARPAAEWVPVSDLPDSDVTVVLWNDALGWAGARVGELEFTDDSEGHGKPYWETSSGPLPVETFDRWMTLPPPPESP